MSFCSDLDLENSNSIFLQDTLTRNDASQYQVWKQNGGLENIIWTNINIWPFTVTLTLHSVILFFFTDHSGLWWCIIRSCLVANESTVQKIFTFVDLDLEDSRQFFPPTWHSGSWCCIIIQSLVTKYSAVQKISSGQTFTKKTEPLLWPWPWMQQSNFSTGHSSLWCCTIKPSWVANGPAV